MTDSLVEKIDAQLAQERADLEVEIERHTKSLAKLQDRYDRAWEEIEEISPLASDDPITEEEQKKWAAMKAAGAAARGTLAAISYAQEKLARLDDPAEHESRVNKARRIIEVRERYGQQATKGDTSMATTTTDTTRTETIKKIVKMRQAGMGLSSIAKKLNEDKVPTFGSAKLWHPPVVRAILRRELGDESTTAAFRKKINDGGKKSAPKASGSKSAKTNGSKAGKAEKIEAKPDPKPSDKKASAK